MVSSEFITEHWPLTDVSLGQVFISYPTRRVVQVFSAQGTFVAKIDEQPPARETSSQTVAVFDFLASHAFPNVPALVKTKVGHQLVETHQQRIVVMEYLDGEQLTATAATWAQLGAIARTLNAFTDYPYPYAIDTSAAIAELRAQANIHPHHAQFHLFISLLAPVVRAPQHGLVHGEINLSNTARRSDGTLVLLDWDQAGHGPTVLEAGYPLIVVFLTEELQFQRELASAFYHHYYEGCPPTSEEKDVLFRAALLHALRYMQFANQQKRWERICFAVAHQDQLLSVIP